MTNGTQVTFTLNIPYLGLRVGAGTIQGAGQFTILGETYTVVSDGSGDYPAGVHVEVKRSSMREEA